MPRKDGTGPVGTGTRAGRGLGACAQRGFARGGAGRGLGMACRHGFGGGLAASQGEKAPRREALLEKRGLLQERLELLDKQLESL